MNNDNIKKNSNCKESKAKTKRSDFENIQENIHFPSPFKHLPTYFLRSRAPPREMAIHLMPKMTRVEEKPKVPEGLKGYNLKYCCYLRVSVQGKSFDLFIDSGSSNMIITKEKAVELELLAGNEKWRLQKLVMVEQEEFRKRTVVKDVEFRLFDGKTLVSNVSVLDDSEGLPSVGGASLLQKYRCLQKFQRDGTSQLYFRSDEGMNINEGKRKVMHEYCLKGHFCQDLEKKPLKIKIDTGTHVTILSKVSIEKLQKLEGYRDFSGWPSKVEILAEDGMAALETFFMVVHENPEDDLCIGRDILCRYEALIDYGSNLIFFSIGEGTYRAELLDGFSGFKQQK